MRVCCRYTALLDRLDTVPMAELVMAIRRTSPGFTRGSSSFRGVTQHKSGALPPPCTTLPCTAGSNRQPCSSCRSLKVCAMQTFSDTPVAAYRGMLCAGDRELHEQLLCEVVDASYAMPYTPEMGGGSGDPC